MMLILFIALGVAVISIGLLLVAFTLRSRSVAAMNFIICLVAGAVIQPWNNFKMQPPVDEDDRLGWIAAMIWMVVFTAGIIVWIYCLIVPKDKKEPKRPKKHRRRKRRRPVEEQVETDQGDVSSDGT